MIFGAVLHILEKIGKHEGTESWRSTESECSQFVQREKLNAQMPSMDHKPRP